MRTMLARLVRPLSWFFRQSTFLVLAWLLGVSSAFAEVAVTFGGSSHYPPFHFLNEQGVPSGFDVDVFNEVATRAGWTADYRFGDWETIQQALSSGLIDVVPMFVSDERREFFHFSEPINIEYHLLFGFADSASYNGLDSLSGLRIAAERGAFATREIVRLNERIDVIGAG
jgi:ABC-type amino acid transport substrate-binding protein